MCQFHDVGICCFCLLCVDDVDIALMEDVPLAAVNLVGVKYNDQPAALRALEIRQDFCQPARCGIEVDGCQLAKLRPVEDDVVAIHQEIILAGRTAGTCVSGVSASAL